MSSQIYYLKNKDEIILEFEVVRTKKVDYYTKKLSIDTKITNVSLHNDLLPLNIDKNDIINSLKNWIDNRKVPKNREFVEDIVYTYSANDKADFMDYIDVSLGLSLNDSFWIIPADKEYKWSKYNLYDNKFDEALKLVAFKGGSYKITGLTTSPEYTTNGMLKKCWHRENDKIYLYKGQTKQYANGGKEAFCEYYMSQIAKALGVEHIDYDLKKFHNEIVSSCELFTSQSEGYCPIYYFLDEEALKKRKGELIQAIEKIFTKEKLNDMLLFDAIIYNTDRHLSNFGIIIDNDTLQILRPAPLFDNGRSIMNFLTETELENIDETLEKEKSFFEYSFDEQLSASVQKRHYDGLKKLSTFTFTRHPEFNLDEKWLVAIEKHIQKRANKALDYLLRNNQNQLLDNLAKELGIDRNETTEISTLNEYDDGGGGSTVPPTRQR